MENNEIDGEAVVMHELLCFEILLHNAKTWILRNGNTDRGANKILTQFGVKTYI